MKNDYLDRSSYVKGLLLLIGKDKRITDEERDFLHTVGTALSFNKKFIEQAIDELFENKYLGNEPPVFSQKQYAEAFLRDAMNLTPFGRTLQIFNITKISTAGTLQFRHTVFRPS